MAHISESAIVENGADVITQETAGANNPSNDIEMDRLVISSTFFGKIILFLGHKISDITMIFCTWDTVYWKTDGFTLKYRIWRFQGAFIEGSSSTKSKNTSFEIILCQKSTLDLILTGFFVKTVFCLQVELEPSMKGPWNRQILYFNVKSLVFLQTNSRLGKIIIYI